MKKKRTNLKIKLFYNKTIPLILQNTHFAVEMLHLQLRVLKNVVNKIKMHTIL